MQNIDNLSLWRLRKNNSENHKTSLITWIKERSIVTGVTVAHLILFRWLFIRSKYSYYTYILGIVLLFSSNHREKPMFCTKSRPRGWYWGRQHRVSKARRPHIFSYDIEHLPDSLPWYILAAFVYLVIRNILGGHRVMFQKPQRGQGHLSKFLTMSTEFDKKSSKWSYYSTDHKNHIKIFFEHFLSKLLDPQKSTFGDVILGIKLF